MELLPLRFVLACGALLSVVALGAGVLFFGSALTQTQVVLLTLVAGALVAECKAASAFIFDGVPDKPADPAAAPAAPEA